MVKILHTSDWHLGHVLYGNERSREHVSMLNQLYEIVKEEKPDLFLLCGDVFHTSQPSSAVNKMFVDALNRIHEAHRNMKMVITAGNHDSPSRHEVFSELWKHLGVVTIGALHPDNITDHIILVPGKCYVIALPYLHSRVMSKKLIQELLDKTDKMNSENLPVVMTAHTTIKNSVFKGHEDITDFSVGGIDSVDLEDMGTGYDYLALGHIHHGQYPDSCNHKVRYSGSPMAVSFDEDYKHSVSIVTINGHNAQPDIKEIEIINPIPLITIPREGAVDWSTAKDLLKEFPDDLEAYIRLNVEVKDFLPPGINEEASEITRNKSCIFCFVNAMRSSIRTEGERKVLTVEEFKQETPLDLFRRYISEKGVESDELIDLFKETLDNLHNL